ncbi:MAG: hypothetical protein J5586_01695 [Clostridia bacterium]|nr:hypothetical protein [Clostridia bacterium]
MIAQSDCVVTHVTNHIASGAAQFKALAEKHGKTVNKGEYKKTKLPLAEELIFGLMALGKEVSASSVYGLLKAHGISERTANEAKKNLGIDSKKQKDGSWAWLPPKQETEQLSIQD